MPLVANDNSWAVCMPKKTGSQSLVLMCSDIASVVGDWHGPDWGGSGKRYLIVRKPIERLASMFWFTREIDGQFHDDCRRDGVNGWCNRFHAAYVAGECRDYTTTQQQLLEQFRPHQVFRLEDGLEAVMAAIGKTIESTAHANRSRNRVSSQETFAGLLPHIRANVDKWLSQDAAGVYP